MGRVKTLSRVLAIDKEKAWFLRDANGLCKCQLYFDKCLDRVALTLCEFASVAQRWLASVVLPGCVSAKVVGRRGGWGLLDRGVDTFGELEDAIETGDREDLTNLRRHVGQFQALVAGLALSGHLDE